MVHFATLKGMELHAHDLKKIYDEHLVLDHLNFDLQDINSLVIIGPSGGGKTTLLRIIAGLESPSGGSLKVNQHEVVFKEDQLRDYRKNIGMVFQAYNLFPHMTAVKNITLPLTKVHNFTQEEAEDRALTLLKRFRLEEHGHKKPSQLSGGQKQRIAISRAVAANPEILLLDEPTSALDPEFTAEVLDLIEELREEGMQLIMVTHEMGFARHVADHILFMAEGDIGESADPETVFNNSSNPAVRQFLDRVLRY
jgi:polar amino acid transport system ATP-binding protein